MNAEPPIARFQVEHQPRRPGYAKRSATPQHIKHWSRPLLTRRVLKFLALLVASWCVMTFTHETGHILAGWFCGGTLRSADLLPWHLPYSIFDPDPKPLVTLWSGPILGVIVPLGLAILIRRDWMWFIAFFCMLANGVYIAAAWPAGDRFLDTPQMLEHGAHPVTVAVYCVLTIVAGYVGFRRSCMRVFAQPKLRTPNDDGSGNRQFTVAEPRDERER
jgi:hypothetical protein